jgi:hypothetical protein
VSGTLGQRIGEYEAEFAHPDPVGALRRAPRGARCASRHRELDGALVRARRHARAACPGRAALAARGCLEAINADSQNGVADQVFLSLGPAVPARARARAARARWRGARAAGLAGEPVHQVDGSGLSREDRVTARAIAALLERVLGAEPETARLYRDFPGGDGPEGHARERLRGTAAEGRVHAKTGWIAGVSCLSGYAEPPPRRPGAACSRS